MSGSQYIGIILSLLPMAAVAAEPADTSVVEMHEVVVTGKHSMLKMRGTAANSELITASDLKRAACCSLGESFTTNPSVDVSYSDAATGARQIKLLGLSGAYVQMLSENVPALRCPGWHPIFLLQQLSVYLSFCFVHMICVLCVFLFI